MVGLDRIPEDVGEALCHCMYEMDEVIPDWDAIDTLVPGLEERDDCIDECLSMMRHRRLGEEIAEFVRVVRDEVGKKFDGEK